MALVTQAAILPPWYDPKLKVVSGGEGFTRLMAANEGVRLYELSGIAAWASVVPRRLGPDATAAELAADKRLCRQIAHVADRMAKLWGDPGTRNLNTHEIKMSGSAVIWSDWWSSHQAYLDQRRHYVATWAIKNRMIKMGNKYVSWLNQEAEEFERIFQGQPQG